MLTYTTTLMIKGNLEAYKKQNRQLTLIHFHLIYFQNSLGKIFFHMKITFLFQKDFIASSSYAAVVFIQTPSNVQKCALISNGISYALML